MPTLMIIEGFRFYFFSLENHEPPHVHVRKGRGKAKLWLNPVHLASSRNLKTQELRRIHELTREHSGEVLERWNEYFHH